MKRNSTSADYLAGVIDFGGSIHITRDLKTGQLFISRAEKQKMDDLLEQIRKITGSGHVKAMSPGNYRNRLADVALPQYQIGLSGLAAEKLLRAVLPALHFKRNEAEIFLQYRLSFEGTLTGGPLPQNIQKFRKLCYERLRQAKRTPEDVPVPQFAKDA